MIKNNLKYLIPIFLLSLFGILTIYMSKSIVVNYYDYLFKQIIYLIIGIVLLFVIKKINFIYVKKYSLFFYIFCVLLLIYVLIFGESINGSKSWINIFGYSFQPSEFAKIALLLCLDKYINTKYGFIKCLFLLLIPSVLTFLQPDTGTVLFYLVIFFSVFISLGLKRRYYIGLFSSIILLVFSYFYLYFFNSELFIDIFGTSFFYRTDRIINFMNSEGYQINNALLGIGNGGIIGNWNNYVIYIPEAITDFMFASILTISGFLGGFFVIIIFIYLDFLLVKDIYCLNKNKYFVIGLFGLFLYQQIQHIYMNIALLPITGITLPFVSYGGSSLISYYILFGLLLNIKKYH
ncbi:MAG: FtsW/RodA/SpoVE family cell cycle protein [Bacilli bacterium]|nr:FtsW/RodA/SpoVE family cell cycle protein [Bacilli bacterium]